MNKFKINNLTIGSKQRPKIIAEISCNHNGSKKRFLKQILEAKKNFADLVKIQSYEVQDMVIGNEKKNIKKGLWKNLDIKKLYKQSMTPFEWHEDAFKLAKDENINLFSTPFSERAVDLLEKYNVPIYKIASFEINDFKLLKAVAKTKKPIILSTGMSSLKEINNTLKFMNKYNKKIIILHCISGYPTPEKEANLLGIRTLQNFFPKNLVGLSDHTSNSNTAIASIPYNPCLIEKHFNYDGKKSHDSKFSINSMQLKDLVNKTHLTFQSIGNGEKILSKSEKNSFFFRRSIYATKHISKGEKFSKDNINTYRPYTGLCASNYFKILGKKSKRNITINKVLKNSDL
tara:strand:- start:67 stop:1101 length:1035 start_codon:yes stop_codon:yes gene_type:complete